MQTVKTGLVEAGAIDIDYRERMIYWSDNALWTINRMNLDTLKTEVIKVENNVLEVNAIDQQYLLPSQSHFSSVIPFLQSDLPLSYGRHQHLIKIC